jgi:hypothetical protein
MATEKACIYLPGYLGNAHRRATSFTPSPAAHSLYPASRLGNSFPSRVLKFGSVAADIYVVSDINFLLNPGFETWFGDPENWFYFSGAGSISQETTVVDEGSSALKMTGVIRYYQDVEVLTGKKYTYGIALRGDATNYSRLQIQDLDTYKWLSTSNTWGTSETYCAQENSGVAYVDKTGTFTVDSSDIVYKTKLRIYLYTYAGYGYADDLYLIPNINFSSVHAHNLPSGAAVSIRASTDNFSSSDVAIDTFTMVQPSFYETFTDQTYRYWKLLIDTQAVGDIIWIGEWCLGDYFTMGLRPQFELPITLVMPKTAVIMQPSRQYLATPEAYRPSRETVLSFLSESESDLKEMRESILQATEWGKEPLIIVPDINHERVLHARVPTDVFPYTVIPRPLWRYDLNVSEDAFPVAGF